MYKPLHVIASSRVTQWGRNPQWYRYHWYFQKLFTVAFRRLTRESNPIFQHRPKPYLLVKQGTESATDRFQKLLCSSLPAGGSRTHSCWSQSMKPGGGNVESLVVTLHTGAGGCRACVGLCADEDRVGSYFAFSC